jgi:hypothetical protein
VRKVYILLVDDALAKLSKCRHQELYLLDMKNSRSETMGNAEEDNRTSRFIEYILRHLIQGVRAREKSVRYRVCQLIAILLNELQEIE